MLVLLELDSFHLNYITISRGKKLLEHFGMLYSDCEAVVGIHKEQQLQDTDNKRKIICNDALHVVFETECTDMFKMNKLLDKHIIPLDQQLNE